MERHTHQVPIDAVEATDLPRETPIKYDEVCKLIGDLYFRLHHQESTQQEQFKAFAGQLQGRIQEYAAENAKLRAEIAELSRNESRGEGETNSPNRVGKGKNKSE